MTTPRRNSRASYVGDSNPLNNILQEVRGNKSGSSPVPAPSSSTLIAAKREPMDILSDCKAITREEFDDIYKVLNDFEENEDKIGIIFILIINYYHCYCYYY